MSRSIAKTYPLITKAMREQSAALRFLGCAMPKEAKGVQYRALQLIDRHVEAAAAAKEELMVTLIFSQSQPFVFDDLDRIRNEYGPAISARVTEILQGRRDDDAYQILKGVTTVALTEHAARNAGDIVRPCGAARILALREGVAKDAAFFETLGCPGLRRAFIKAKASLLARADAVCGKAPAPKQKSRRKATLKTP